jgi:hypothetical protein
MSTIPLAKARGALPAEALEVERIAGLFDAEWSSASLWSLEEFNQFAPRPFTEADILMYSHTPRSAVTRLVCDCARAETGTNVRTA